MSTVTTKEKIKYFHKSGTSIDMSFQKIPNKFNSYREWRKASNYTKEQNSKLIDLISANSKLYTYSQCIEKLNQCINCSIPPNDIVIAILYLSCHHFSPHAMNLLKHLLTNYPLNIDLFSTSISSPQFMIPHIAAMNSDISLLQMYYNLNGNINVKDGRGVLPITIAIAERHLQFCETLFWMNTYIPIQQLSVLEDRTYNDVAPFIAAFIHFINIIELSKKYIYNQLNIPKELIDILIDYVLPIDAYNGVKKLMDVFKTKKIKLKQWEDIYTVAMEKLNEDNDVNMESDNKHMKCIGVDVENNVETIYKMVTKIYVKPTRNKQGMVVIPYESSKMIKSTLKWIVVGAIGMTSAAVIWKRFRK
eukprot:251265_1